MFKSKTSHDCMKTEDDLRTTRCGNMELLMLVMKNELECNFSHGSYNFRVTLEYFLLVLCFLVINLIFNFKLIN